MKGGKNDEPKKMFIISFCGNAFYIYECYSHWNIYSVHII